MLQTPLYSPFCKPITLGLFPSTEKLVQNLIPPLGKKSSNFQLNVFKTSVHRGTSKLNGKTREEAICKMYGQALSYNVESKCSQGNEQQKKRHKRQIYSEMATDLQHLNSPGAFSAARPGNQKPQRDSAFKMTPQFPFLLLCGCGTSLRS